MKENNTITCTRVIHFCAGHRVMGHENKCATPHGHNYYVEIFAEAISLDGIGRVIDFSLIKEAIGSWIDRFWDHTFLVFEKDIQMIEALKMMPGVKEPYICPFNPTAENIALYLLNEISPRLLQNKYVQVTKVKVYETDNCYATASLKDF